MARFMEWIDERFPATKVWEEHVAKYYTPKNFNFWYYFGSLLLLVMVLQVLTAFEAGLPGLQHALGQVENQYATRRL